MKFIVLSLLMTSMAVPGSAADNPSFSGKWQVHNSIAGNESDSDCTFTLKATEVTGSCTIEKGSAKATGKVDGSKITWSYDSEYNGTPLTMKYSGTLDLAGAKISGTVTVEAFSVDGEFTATQAK